MPSKPTSASHPVDRRAFLRTTSAAAAATLGAQALAGQRAKGANERLSIGLIGAGIRGTNHLNAIKSLAKRNNAEITAVCDVWKVNLERAAAAVKSHWGKDPRASTRFGDLLEMEDLDAVVISTPDFSHSTILDAALQADKDVYIEKPMVQTIEEANRALDLARAKHRVVQVGTQARSHPANIGAAKEVASGVLGRISRVSAANHSNGARWARTYADCKEPDVDWKAYLLDKPKRPFDPKLLRRWQLYRMCTQGMCAAWMSHFADLLHLMTGTTYPSSVVAQCGLYAWTDDREMYDTYHGLLEYPEGFLYSYAVSLTNAYGSHNTIHGTEGTLVAEGNALTPTRWRFTREGGRGSTHKDHDVEPLGGGSHMGDWLECLRSRKMPRADIQYGHQHSVATIMASAALETGLRQVYDQGKRSIAPG
jgi:predicted dehydrogenase